MNATAPSYHAVWLYHRFCPSFRDVEDLLAERGITVSYETIRQWCLKFGTEFARRLKRREARLGICCDPPTTGCCESAPLLFGQRRRAPR